MAEKVCFELEVICSQFDSDNILVIFSFSQGQSDPIYLRKTFCFIFYIHFSCTQGHGFAGVPAVIWAKAGLYPKQITGHKNVSTGELTQ